MPSVATPTTAVARRATRTAVRRGATAPAVSASTSAAAAASAAASTTRREALRATALAALFMHARNNDARAAAAAVAPAITRVVVSCVGARAADAARALAAQVPEFELMDEDAVVVRDGSRAFAVEFQDAVESPTSSDRRGVELVGFVVGGDNPARARNTAIRNGGASASNGERCSGDAFAGCRTNTSSGESLFGLTFVKTGAPWAAKTAVVVRVVVRDGDVDAVAANVTSSLGPTAKRGFVARGVVEYAAEDRKDRAAFGRDSSTIVGYENASAKTTPSIGIEIVQRDASSTARSAFSVKALHVALPEGCGVVYL